MKQIPRDHKDEAARLKQKIMSAGGRAVSMERKEFDEEGKDAPTVMLEEQELDTQIPIGSFVELRRRSNAIHGVIIRRIPVNGRAGIDVLTSSGEMWQATEDDVFFHIDSFLPEDLVSRAGIEETATNKHELAARTKILLKLRDMDRDLEERRESYSISHESIYEQFRDPDPNAWGRVSSEQVARAVLPKDKKPSIVDILVAHKFLNEGNLHFLRQYTFISKSQYDVRPKAHVELLTKVLQWARPRAGHKDQRAILDSFAAKAAAIVRKQQELTHQTLDEPLTRVPAQHVWSENDLVILKTMFNAIDVRGHSYAYEPAMWYVLSRVYPDLAHIDDDTLVSTLRALGVLSPTLNNSLLMPPLRLEINLEDRQAVRRRDDAVVERSSAAATRRATHPTAQTSLGPEDLHAVDPLDAVRHDWGDMPVYVVDDLNAHELDDGVSVEKDGDSVWVHVHVADPASVLPRSHIFVQHAAERVESVYLDDRTYNLLPPSLVQHPVFGASLGGKRERPDRVLTFSTKVNAQGTITDFAVRAGLARNVKKLSYDSVDAALGLPRNLPDFAFGMPKELPHIPLANLDAADLDNLRLLQDVAKCLIQRRCDDGIFVNKEYKAKAWSVAPGPEKDICFEPSSFRGMQRIELAVGNVKLDTAGMRGIIAEAMKLAGRAASLYGLKHDIPLIRRSASAPMPRTDADIAALLDMRDEEGYVNWHHIMRRVDMPGAGSYTLQPRAHFSLGVPEGEGYVRVTSPLRRFADLLAHYNIHHRLLNAPGPMPFDTRATEAHMEELRSITRLMRRIESSQNTYRTAVFMQQFVEDVRVGCADGTVLRDLDGYVTMNTGFDSNVMDFRVDCYVPKLGLRLRAYKDDAALPLVGLGDRVRLSITGARTGSLPHVIARISEVC
ncbi:hypothetical protein BD626DRAFT_401140 [Schizophyllum amplum]|uniref:RNB domain-containing protein n=1 Tax=Schizophyllum amplum TaxID=97359 RepID=A0A550CHM7_9AGAR|nr:hypothetical protein BD626DRAFT_401140 [Auriculariopsis ampla]